MVKVAGECISERKEVWVCDVVKDHTAYQHLLPSRGCPIVTSDDFLVFLHQCVIYFLYVFRFSVCACIDHEPIIHNICGIQGFVCVCVCGFWCISVDIGLSCMFLFFLLHVVMKFLVSAYKQAYWSKVNHLQIPNVSYVCQGLYLRVWCVMSHANLDITDSLSLLVIWKPNTDVILFFPYFCFPPNVSLTLWLYVSRPLCSSIYIYWL